MKNKLKKAFNLSDEAISIIEALIPLDDFKIALEEDGLFPNTKSNIVIEKGFITDNNYAYAIFHLGSDSTLEIMAAYANQKHFFHEKIHGIISPNNDYRVIFSGYTNADGTERKVLGKQDNNGFAYYGEDKYYQATHQDEFLEEVSPDIIITAAELDKLLSDGFSNNETRLLI